ncbi:hypothetical protein [uncultured Porphyromonas sp.]|uniref:hypothetical protein n=1 Tax=uncultured Porphyromonas sp. TaxID=159274 RepID=UPI002615E449|nr:hypothetical protein [uncultured Porphyromonas sp.]
MEAISILEILTDDGQRTTKQLTYVSTDEDGDKHYNCSSANSDLEEKATSKVLGDPIRQLSIAKVIRID